MHLLWKFLPLKLMTIQYLNEFITFEINIWDKFCDIFHSTGLKTNLKMALKTFSTTSS